MIKRATGHTDKPGLVILQIDGLAHPILAARMRAGSVNTLASWVRNGTHKLSRWEAILPSMTSASQAGILHGNNDEIPRLPLVRAGSQAPDGVQQPDRRDADRLAHLQRRGPALEQRREHLQPDDRRRHAVLPDDGLDQGRGRRDRREHRVPAVLLQPVGLPPLVHLVRRRVHQGDDPGPPDAALRHPAPDAPRGEVRRHAGRQQRDPARRQRRPDHRGDVPRDERHLRDFTDYDELAHHCGPERVESFQALDGVDQAIGTLVHATENAPRPYKFIVLSDHGQSLGATFKQRYGKSLGEYIRELMGGRATVVQSTSKAEGSMFVNAFLSEITKAKGVGPSVARAALSGRTTDGVVDLDAEEQPPAADESSIAVVGSGNLGLVWFTGNDHRLTVEELEELHPGLVSSVAAHPGVAMLLVRSKEHGAVVFGPKGTRYLDQDRVEGEDPTTLFGPNTIMSLKREDAMKHAPDLLLLSQYNPDLGEVAAFEELIGSHGGLGGPQTEPFILHPAEWELDEALPVGAPAIYRNIRRWLESIGIRLGSQPEPAPTPVEPAAEPAAAGSGAA
jgi:hypothetical protein